MNLTFKNLDFIQSFRCFSRKYIGRYIITVALDLAYYLIFLVLLTFFLRYVVPKASFLFQTKAFVEGMKDLPLETLLAMGSQIESSFYMFGILTALILIVLLVSFCFLKGVIWSKILEKKYSWKTFLRLCLANVIIVVFVFLMMMFISYFVKDANQVTVALLGLLPLTIHFSHVLNAVGVFEDTVKGMFKSFFRISILKIYKFILPYIMMLVVLAVLVNVLIYVQPLFINLSVLYYIIYLLLFVVYSCWAKYYLALVVKNC